MNNFIKDLVTIDDLLAGDVKLCSPPEIFVKVNSVLESPNSTSQDIANSLVNDAGLAARVLKLANSPIYGLVRKVESISHAVALLGKSNLKNLVLTTVIMSRFSKLEPHGTVREFWNKSLRTALFAKHLANPMAMQSGSASFFIAGLLHDLGLLILFQKLPELTRAAHLHAETERTSLQSAEKKLIGFDHFQLGAQLCEKWNLPEILRISMTYHGNSPEAPPGFKLTCQLIYIAHGLANIETKEEGKIILADTNISEEEYDRLINQVESEHNQVASYFFS